MVGKGNSRYEILASLPVYGPMYIPVTESGEAFYSEGFVVRFYRADGTNWVANFQLGWTDFNEVQALENNTNLLIIAGGTCYLMDPEETRPTLVFGAAVAAIFKLTNGCFVLQNDVDLIVVETNGTHWHSSRISWDGLKDLTVSGTIISGFSFDPINDVQEVPFSYNVDTRELVGGSYQLYELALSAKRLKPWWKFW
jgi:hypothetical protein